MGVPLPDPTQPAPSRTDVFLAYLDYFRDQVIGKLAGLSARELRHSRLPSDWTPIELLRHLTCVETRWFEWGFEGRDVGDPWAEWQDEAWYVPASETLDNLVTALHAQAARTRAIVEAHDLTDVGKPSNRWDGGEPPTLERVLFHAVQEYARHAGHLDIVAELSTGNAEQESADPAGEQPAG